jgi:hypothetical protein
MEKLLVWAFALPVVLVMAALMAFIMALPTALLLEFLWNWLLVGSEQVIANDWAKTITYWQAFGIIFLVSMLGSSLSIKA